MNTTESNISYLNLKAILLLKNLAKFHFSNAISSASRNAFCVSMILSVNADRSQTQTFKRQYGKIKSCFMINLTEDARSYNDLFLDV